LLTGLSQVFAGPERHAKVEGPVLFWRRGHNKVSLGQHLDLECSGLDVPPQLVGHHFAERRLIGVRPSQAVYADRWLASGGHIFSWPIFLCDLHHVSDLQVVLLHQLVHVRDQLQHDAARHVSGAALDIQLPHQFIFAYHVRRFGVLVLLLQMEIVVLRLQIHVVVAVLLVPRQRRRLLRHGRRHWRTGRQRDHGDSHKCGHNDEFFGKHCAWVQWIKLRRSAEWNKKQKNLSIYRYRHHSYDPILRFQYYIADISLYAFPAGVSGRTTQTTGKLDANRVNNEPIVRCGPPYMPFRERQRNRSFTRRRGSAIPFLPAHLCSHQK